MDDQGYDCLFHRGGLVINPTDYGHLVEFILSAVESAQQEPAEFSDETEKRLALVFRKLNQMLNLPEDYDPNSP